MKVDFKKQEKDLYIPGTKPTLVTVPAMNFIMLDGKGDPGSESSFPEAVEALYGVSYSIKMMPKKGFTPEGYFDYVVPPLEGLWWVETGKTFSFDKKDEWLWTLMIRQPEFVTEELVWETVDQLKVKKNNPQLANLRYEIFEEGICVQVMHIGPYSTEPETNAIMERFLEENGYRTTFYKGGKHHEVYLSDPRKSEPEALKTVLRHPVEKK